MTSKVAELTGLAQMSMYSFAVSCIMETVHSLSVGPECCAVAASLLLYSSCAQLARLWHLFTGQLTTAF